LSQKQDTIGANDLSISFVSGLQTELDGKATATELTNGLNMKHFHKIILFKRIK
jgi:hypothetical protein